MVTYIDLSIVFSPVRNLNEGDFRAMFVSGFTFCRNVDKLGYPFVESIRSVLPLVDEFGVYRPDQFPTPRIFLGYPSQNQGENVRFCRFYP